MKILPQNIAGYIAATRLLTSSYVYYYSDVSQYNDV